jgi:maleylacetate reductase
MLEFTHDTLPQRVLFGAGSAARNLRAEVERLGGDRLMLIAAEADRALADVVAREIAPALVWSDVAQHVPIETAAIARSAAAEADVDLVVSVGGGSTTGLAKAIALECRVRIVAVPTTYAGSEATNMWGLTEAARKTTGVDDRVLPVSVIYDAELTTSLPVELSVASGLNGIAHCVDSLWAPRADPINAALAGEGIRALAAGLRVVVADPAGIPGREKTQYGAYLAAVAFASAGSGLHHKICHVLGGTYNLPHAQTHAVMLPYVAAFNLDSAPGASRRLGVALDSGDGLAGLAELYADLNAPRSLRDLDFDEARIPEAVEIALPAIPTSNPRQVDAAALTALLTAAWKGAPLDEVRSA